MKAILSNRVHPELGVATIPLPIPDKEYAHCMELLSAMEIGDVTDHDCYVERIIDAPPALDVLEDTMINVDELDFLARSLEQHGGGDLAKFCGMACLKGFREVMDLINLSLACCQATVISDFSDLDRIGKDHYLTIRGGGAPSTEVKALNGAEIARKLIAEERGEITPYGVVYDNGMTIEALYTGKNFPSYSERAYLLTVLYDSPGREDCRLFLPMAEKRLERLLERAGILNAEEPHIKDWDSELSDELLSRIHVTRESVFELNRLCAAVEALDEAARKKLDAVVQCAEPEYAFQMRHLAENLELFDFVPGVQTADGYGRYLIQESGHYEYDENLEPYYDYEKCGQEQMDSESGAFSTLGYVSYHGTLSLDELMMEDPADLEEDFRETHWLEMGGMA